MADLYDPFSPELHEDPYPVYRTLRDDEPAHYSERRRYWVLSRFEDVWTAVHDPGTFCSGKGIFPTRKDVAADSFLPMIIMMDPPRHTELRRIVSLAFTPRRIATMEESVRQAAGELLAAVAAGDRCDLVSAFAGPLPAMVIADMMGVSRADRAEFRLRSEQLVTGSPDDPASRATVLEASLALYRYFEEVVRHRRSHPGDDLVSALVAAEVHGERLAEQELLGFCVLLLVAGNETTTNLIGNAAVLLARHPDQRAALAADPSLLPGAVEECVRYDAPVQALARTLTTDVERHGRHMAAGERVLVVFGAANRDEREFPDPDRFDVRRRMDRHLGFGHGIHHCLGANLARLEARVALHALLGRLPDYELDDGAERLRSGPIRGYRRLPIGFHGVPALAGSG